LLPECIPIPNERFFGSFTSFARRDKTLVLRYKQEKVYYENDKWSYDNESLHGIKAKGDLMMCAESRE
jgi:hypothetical protein